jgi:hypothetical protein
MIKITSAEHWYKYEAISSKYCTPDRSGDPYLYYVLLGPCKPRRYRMLNLDSLVQGETFGNEKEVYHRKYEGTLCEIGPWTEGKYTYVPVTSVTHYNSDGSIFRVCNAYEDYYIATYPGPNGGYTEWRLDVVDNDGTYDRTVHTVYPDGTEQTWYDPRYSQFRIVAPPPKPIDSATVRANIAFSDKNAPAWHHEAENYYSDVNKRMFRDCCHGIMPLETNNIANIKSIIDMIRGIPGLLKGLSTAGSKLKQYIEIDDVGRYLRSSKLPKKLLKEGADPKKAAEAWLSYRYVYTTTKMDIIAHKKHLKQQLEAWNESNARKTRHMHATATVDDTVYHMKVDITPRLTNAVEELWVKSRAFGLQLNAVNAWDMVPFSFIADWFAPIGDYLQVLDDSVLFNSTHFNFGPIVVSAKRECEVQTQYGMIKRIDYDRSVLRSTPTLDYVEDHDPSSRTKVYRGLDAASLVVGMR